MTKMKYSLRQRVESLISRSDRMENDKSLMSRPWDIFGMSQKDQVYELGG